ncbi:zinc finger protein basonuclin-2 [Biomphalaria glabrata]|nr:zinc finger protein basonuclin-2 [Biomphalaria glabrata]
MRASNHQDTLEDDEEIKGGVKTKSPKVDNELAEEKKNDSEDNDEDEDDASGRESSEEYMDSLQDYPSELYLDKENPLKCKLCGKVFQNTFTVKIHFQNVHLKLMHSCTVDGCLATFPSKRSRDRHSANVNLHRRLLSGDGASEEEMDDALRGNILAKLYGRDLVGTCASPVRKSVNGDGEQNIANNNNNNNEQDAPKISAVPTSEPLKMKITIHTP